MAAGGFQCWLLALPRPRKSLHTAHRQSALAPTRQRPSTVRGSRRFAGRQAGGDPCWPPIRLLVGPCQADSRGLMRQGDAGHRIGTGLAIVPHVPSVPPCGRPPLASTKKDRRSPHTPRPAHRPEWFTTGNPLARNLPTVYRSITARRHRKRRAWAGLSDGLSWLVQDSLQLGCHEARQASLPTTHKRSPAIKVSRELFAYCNRRGKACPGLICPRPIGQPATGTPNTAFNPAGPLPDCLARDPTGWVAHGCVSCYLRINSPRCFFKKLGGCPMATEMAALTEDLRTDRSTQFRQIQRHRWAPRTV